jgi:hypothetical protein
MAFIQFSDDRKKLTEFGRRKVLQSGWLNTKKEFRRTFLEWIVMK